VKPPKRETNLRVKVQFKRRKKTAKRELVFFSAQLLLKEA
jgi:hypothetical protein